MTAHTTERPTRSRSRGTGTGAPVSLDWETAAAKPLPVDKLLLTPIEAAHCLGIGRSKVYQLFRAGRLESVHLDGSRRVRVAALAEFVETLARTTSE